MKLLILLLTLMSEPVTMTGSVQINRQIGGKPIEYLLKTEAFNDVRTPLIAADDFVATSIDDVVFYNLAVTVTGFPIEQRNRQYLLVHKVTVRPP